MVQTDFSFVEASDVKRSPRRLKRTVFTFSKLAFDKIVAALCLPLIALVALVLLIVNPIYNPGPLFFRQKRMGRNGTSFQMIKFRTMLPATCVTRSHNDGVEVARITRLGAILRKFRIDELPNMLNVLFHEMSIIGPRPDAWDHAVAFLREIPVYKDRFSVLPGITGLAQVRQGYAEGVDQTVEKARLDRVYIRKQGFLSEISIIVGTFRVILSGFGAR